MPKPSTKPDWTLTNPTARVEPTAPKKETGWAVEERPPAEFMNWLFYNLTEWVIYLEDVTDGLAGLDAAFDAVVGINGTHATINDLMADANIANIKRVLVTTAQTVTANQVINQNDMEFVFKPQAVLTKGGGSTIGIVVNAERVSIKGARIVSFNAAGNKGLELTANARNCLVTQCRFLDNDTDLDDLGANNSLSANISEVV